MFDKSNSPSLGQTEYLRQKKRQKRMIIFIQIFILGIFFLLWEIFARAEIIDPFIFSSPGRMLKALAELLEGGELFLHLGITVFETAAGFVLGTLIGTGAA
ncbi:MAG: ABC transporter permease, partial [Firmicutes bacterium]|nr:ABC transporter permease [Bacillota bacterium]